MMTTNYTYLNSLPSYVYDRLASTPKTTVKQKSAVRKEKTLTNAIEKRFGKVQRSVFSDNTSVVSDSGSVVGSVIDGNSVCGGIEEWKSVPYRMDDSEMCYLVVVDGDGRYLRPIEVEDFINSVGRRDKFKDWKKSSPQNAKNKFNVVLNSKGEILYGIHCVKGHLDVKF